MNKQTTTNNIKALNKDVEIIKKHFSHCFDKNGNFDLEKFKNELSKNEIDFSNESYGMDWLGKSYARLLASDEATTLLKEDKKWNDQPQNTNSQNLLIKGDNLEVLKHLSSAYYEKVKMIYIDPPYNTGSDGFVYQDDRKFTVEEFRKLAGVDEEKAKRILDFVDSKSNSHSAWLTFMYPRLYIAKQLLRDDGVIFVSIDDNEVAQLRILMDEIFGEENFRNQIAVKRGAKSVQSQFENIDKLGIAYESMLLYSKSSNFRLPQFHFDLQETKEGSWNNHWRGTDRPTMRYPLLGCDISSGQWRWSKNRSDEAVLNYQKLLSELKNDDPAQEEIDEWFMSNDDVDLLRLSKNGKPEHYVPPTDKKFGHNLWTDIQVGKTSSLSVLNLNYFDNPKNPELLIRIMKWLSSDSDIVLDFFAGSGTTGDAVMQLNADDGGNRKFILVQLAEEIDQKKNKVAYDFVKNELGIENPTIFDITKERLIRAGKKIQQDNKDLKEPKKLSNVDFGFKVFETTPIWDGYNIDAEDFDSQMELFNENKLSNEDLQTLLTTWKTYDGVPLTQNAVAINLDGYIAYYLDTRLYLMNKGFSTKNLKKLLDEIDVNNDFNPRTVIAFGYNFESKILRELEENIKNYANKKEIEIDFIARY